MNYQTAGRMIDIYEGMFLLNASCGYVLKPTCLRELESLPMKNNSRLERTRSFTTSLRIRVGIFIYKYKINCFSSL